MKLVAALLAAASLLAGLAGCGGSGAEPGAPSGATLVLDFTPNAVHSGIYAAQREGFYGEESVDLKSVDLTIRQPGASTDAPKLLAAGRADVAILDIHDLGIARERGIAIAGMFPLVQRPLAAIIVRADRGIASPADLEGHTVGVTGLPSDEAVVDSEVSADGGDPAKVKRVTIGFNAISALATGKVDAVTGFWNAEAIALRRQGVPIRVFKVDEYGAPPYPELVLATSWKALGDDPELVFSVLIATLRGYQLTVEHPERALDDLLAEVPGLDRAEQRAQLDALLPDLRPAPFDPAVLRAWARWDLQHGLLERPLDVSESFRLGLHP